MRILPLFVILSMVAASSALAAGSASVTPTASKDVTAYNKGVQLMLEKKFARAEKQFRKALKHNEQFPEAHNNLAYTLRKQGEEHFEEALTHYNRAIALNPALPEPFMYRGVLYVQMGRSDSARQDHATLVTLSPELAAELEYVIANGREKEPERFFGVSRRK